MNNKILTQLLAIFFCFTFCEETIAQSEASQNDSLPISKKIKQDYYFKTGTNRARYAHIKERIEILHFINSLVWTEKQKLEIFNLYINTQYHSETHEVELNKANEAGTLKEVLEQNRTKLHKRLVEISGIDGSNNFWKSIEAITNKYTDHSKF